MTKSSFLQFSLLLLLLLINAACGFQVNSAVARNNHDPLRPSNTPSSSIKTRWTQPPPSGQRDVGCPRTTTTTTALCALPGLSRQEIAKASQGRVLQSSNNLNAAKKALEVKETALQATEKALEATKKALEAKEEELLLIDRYRALAPWSPLRLLKLWLQDINNTQTQVRQEDAQQDARDAEKRVQYAKQDVRDAKQDVRDAEKRVQYAKQDVRDAENALKSAQRQVELCIQWTDDEMHSGMVPDFLMNRATFEKKSNRFNFIYEIGSDDPVLRFEDIKDGAQYYGTDIIETAKESISQIERTLKNQAAAHEVAATRCVKEMLEHCSGHNFGELVSYKTSFNIDENNNLGSGVKMEIDGLLVYQTVYVYIEAKSTIEDIQPVEKALKNAKTLATTNLGLGCHSKHAVVVLAYNHIKKPELANVIDSHKVIQVTKTGSELGFVLDGDVKSCSPNQFCNGFCALVADRILDLKS